MTWLILSFAINKGADQPAELLYFLDRIISISLYPKHLLLASVAEQAGLRLTSYCDSNKISLPLISRSENLQIRELYNLPAIKDQYNWKYDFQKCCFSKIVEESLVQQGT